MGVAFRVDWDEVRDHVVAGVPAVEVAKRFGITPGAIRVRSHREGWPTPGRIGRKRAELRTLRQAGGEPIDVSRNLAEVAEQYADTVARHAMAKVRAGIGRLPEPRNWRELAQADTVARRAAGLDHNGDRATAVCLIRVGMPPPIDVSGR